MHARTARQALAATIAALALTGGTLVPAHAAPVPVSTATALATFDDGSASGSSDGDNNSWWCRHLHICVAFQN